MNINLFPSVFHLWDYHRIRILQDNYLFGNGEIPLIYSVKCEVSLEMCMHVCTYVHTHIYINFHLRKLMEAYNMTIFYILKKMRNAIEEHGH